VRLILWLAPSLVTRPSFADLMTRGALRLAAVGAILLGILVAPDAPRLAAARLPCEVDRVDRIVAVGDIHGAYDRLVEILRAAGLLDGKLHWSGGRTHYVQLGDILDRGPDSRKALDLMRKLEVEAPRAGGAVHVLLGNHEAMRMLGDRRYTVPAEYQAFVNDRSDEVRQAYLKLAPPSLRDQLLKDTPLGEVEMRLAFGRQGIYGEWLRKLNVVIKINGVVFVHGGISPVTSPLSCDDVNRAARRELTEEEEATRAEPLRTLVSGEDGPLWYRGLAEEPDTFAPEVDRILDAQNARAIVIGHTVTPDGRIRVRFGGKVVQIDTGMQPQYVKNGRASALEIQHEIVTAIYTDRRDVLLTRLPGARTDLPVSR